MFRARLRRIQPTTILVVTLLAGVAAATIVPMTLRDFHVPGTQVGNVPASNILPSSNCKVCHGNIDATTDPSGTWSGSLMAQAGRDPLFYAQMALANQDVSNVGYYCLRCHVPMSIVTGHALQADGSTLDARDKEGVSCHFCHAMVDPTYQPGSSPVEDQAILAGLDDAPEHYGNAMFVLDPAGSRRGPRADAAPMHEFLRASFFKSGSLCGTCHDVGNVAVTRQSDGTYQYNAIDQPSPDMDPEHQFPLERTYTEWKLSEFASSGVDMGGRFGGAGATVVSTCQDCHMPRAAGRACFAGPDRSDLATHEFAGAAAQVLDIIASFTEGDPLVDQAAIARARAASVSMLERAATVEVAQRAGRLGVRVVNHSGHKLPTGHIEGRRVWLNVRFLDESGSLVSEHGAYDSGEARLDASRTEVYEMHVGLSAAASAATGLPAGETSHMALANTIEKDNRIPPRGFSNAAFAAAGAPVVRAAYADGQYWSDVAFPIPVLARRAEVALYYQQTPREYIDHLLEANTSNQWGQVLHQHWTRTGRGAPVRMAALGADLAPFCPADLDDGTMSGTPDGQTTPDDLLYFLGLFADGNEGADADDGSFNGTPDGGVTIDDLLYFIVRFAEGC